MEGVEGGEQWPEVGEGAGFFQAVESAARGKVSEDVGGEGGPGDFGGEAVRGGEEEGGGRGGGGDGRDDGSVGVGNVGIGDDGRAAAVTANALAEGCSEGVVEWGEVVEVERSRWSWCLEDEVVRRQQERAADGARFSGG